MQPGRVLNVRPCGSSAQNATQMAAAPDFLLFSGRNLAGDVAAGMSNRGVKIVEQVVLVA